jgi:hypothetical protein
MVHVASLRRLRQDQVEDGRVDVNGYVRPCYSYFIIFYVLGHRSILIFLVFYLPINRNVVGWCFLQLLQLSYAIPRLGLVCLRILFLFSIK